MRAFASMVEGAEARTELEAAPSTAFALLTLRSAVPLPRFASLTVEEPDSLARRTPHRHAVHPHAPRGGVTTSVPS